MMKTLWLGCSYSSGIYNKKDNRIGLHGVPVEVACQFNWDDWKIISAPGQGILEFNVILSHLDNKDLLDFDNLIIQNTTEPRLVSFDEESERKKFEYLENYMKLDNKDRERPYYRYDADYTHPENFTMTFNMHPISLYNRYRHYFNNVSEQAVFLEIADEINRSLDLSLSNHIHTAYKNIVEIAQRRGINLYTFCWQEEKSSYKHYKTKSYRSHDLFDGKGLLESFPKLKEACHPDSLHPYTNGVTIASEKIIEALKQKGFKG